MFETEDLIKVGNEYYFAAKEINAICKFTETDRCIEIIRTDPSGDIWAYRRYGRIFSYKDLLIFSPLWASTFLIYHISDQTFETIDIKKKEGCSADYFAAGKIIGENLVLAGCQYPSIAVINLNDFSVEYYDKPFENILDLKRHLCDCFFRFDMVSVGNAVYIASCISNKVLEFHPDNGSYRWHTVGGEGNRYVGIAWDGERMWLSPRRESKIVCWDPFSGENLELENPVEDLVKEKKIKCSFLGTVYDGENIILPGMHIDKSIIINPKTKAMKIIEGRYDFYIHTEGINYGLGADGILKLYQPGEYEKPVKLIKTVNDKNVLAKLINDMGGLIIKENEHNKLEDFIDLVKIM